MNNEISQLLYKEDTDWVRDNLLMNYCLWDDNTLLIESYYQNNAMPLHFNIDHFYMIITGVDKKFNLLTSNYSFHKSLTDYKNQKQRLSKVLNDAHCTYDIFLIKVENSKQIAILFSPESDDDASMQELSSSIYQTSVDERYYPSSDKQYVVTSLSRCHKGYEEIHLAYLEARYLNNLSFFKNTYEVITASLIEESKVSCTLVSIAENCTRLRNMLSYNTLEEIEHQIDYLFYVLIQNSYDISLFQAAYTYCHNCIDVIMQVYDIALSDTLKPEQDYLSLRQFVDHFHAIIREVYAQLISTPRYNPELLLVISYIKNNYAQDLSLRTLAQYAGTTPTRLSTAFNKAVSMSLSDYINMIRIRHACTLLSTTHIDVASICINCGFTNEKYFTKICELLPPLYRSGGFLFHSSLLNDTSLYHSVLHGVRKRLFGQFLPYLSIMI